MLSEDSEYSELDPEKKVRKFFLNKYIVFAQYPKNTKDPEQYSNSVTKFCPRNQRQVSLPLFEDSLLALKLPGPYAGMGGSLTVTVA